MCNGPKNPHVTVDKAVNQSQTTVSCSMSSKGISGPFFFEGTVTGTSYKQMLEKIVMH
jgi:hypothetical protein